MSTNAPSSLSEDAQIRSGTASASLWWNHVPSMMGEKIGVIGQFAVESESDVATLLCRACEDLSAHGCTLAIGPMDGNTWNRYRFVTESSDEPAFLLEPMNPIEWPRWWLNAGFERLAEYFSTATEDLVARDPRVHGLAERMTAAGVTLRSLDAEHFEEDLERIYEVSLVSFTGNFLYTPLPREAFFAQYRQIKDRVRPEIVLIAEQAGHPVGYVFALPDYAQAQRGEPITTVIVKTLAVWPGRQHAGLGAWLLAEVHAEARKLGFTRAIHALMHETNKSRNLSAHYAKTIRRYTLFSKRLAHGTGGTA